ncbi:uncharacterized protein B0P05DRAFT_525362 [Gilbertella persicaria]|uniref:uncharacterized protein n=1 Tax=Gilbertella persicaria TaxID=101096 RepID=UPI00221EA11B|nr:uncharacterized protein B0P05DRAFT_525362 [Gilbertella persicaria]KAI8092232.1 hypothetical protein B0P05DRAFT_525362 [Gilbertella persicaria]
MLPGHTLYIKSLYKRILVEASYFFDDRTRLFIQTRTKKSFRNYRDCQDLERIKYKIKEARKRLHRLERANRGNQKDALKVLEEAYGRTGKTRHALLYPYLHCYGPLDGAQPTPLVPHVPRTAPPPPLCPALRVLVTHHLNKRLEPILPEPQFKPLHPGRKANLLWRYRSMLLSRIQLPLPFEILVEIESKAGASVTHPLAAAVRGTGGPIWAFYQCLKHDMVMSHLDPHVKLPPPLSSQLRRTQPLTSSPYSTHTPLLIEPMEPLLKEPVEYDARKRKRLYRKLLRQIPLITKFEPNELWKQGMQYQVSASFWVPKAVNEILKDIPTQQVIDSTIKKKRK